MPNPQNPALASPSQNLRSSSRGVRKPPADQTPVRETPLERAARREAEKKKAERRAAKAAEAAKAAKAVKAAKAAEAAAAAKAAEAAAAAKATEAAAKASTKRKRVVGAGNRRKKRQKKTKESKKTKTTKAHNTLSDSGEIESADDDSCFEPTDGADDNDDDDDDDDDDQADDDDNNDEGEEIDSYVSADSYLDDDPLASPEKGRRSAREATTEESRHSAQAGAVNPLRTSNSEEHGTPPPPPGRADTREIVSRMPLEAPTAQKNVVRRIVLFVKNTLFRQIKFVTSTISFNKAFQKVLAEERPRNPYIFQLTYQNSFKTALNQKRSTCELSGKNIVVKAINTVFKNREEEFFTFDEFCKLRRATTEREREAFFWFFDSFLECVCGATAWNNAKTKQLISEARDPSGSKIVSVSDEAFALLLIDNYLEKWKTRAGEEVAARIDSVAGGAAAITAEGKEITRRKQTKTAGKYTAKAQGQCKWGGWSPEGIKQFNFLRKLVKADREADKNCDDEPKRMEKLLMDFCRTKAGIKDPQDNANLDGADNNAAARAMENVEAEWDSDDD